MRPQDLKQALHGIVSILITPFNQDYELDVVGLERNIEHLAKHGVKSIIVGGTFGEYPSMSAAERTELFRHAVRFTAGRMAVVACTANPSTREAVALTQQAAAAGADGVMVTPPYVSEVQEGDIIRHFEAVARDGGAGIMLYNSTSIGNNLSAALLARITEIDEVVAIKQGNTDALQLAESFHLVGDRATVLCGSDSMILTGLALGMPGCTSTNSGFLTRHYLEIADAVQRGNLPTARRLYYSLAPFRSFARRAGQPATAKAAMELVGLAGGQVRAPFQPLAPEQRAELQRLLEAAEAL